MSNANQGMGDKFESAAEACKKISSEAENIKAGFDGATGVADAIGAAFTFGLSRLGKDLKAENEIKEQARNILNVDLSSNDIMKISNDCMQSGSIKQINTLRWDPACINSPIISQGIRDGTIQIKKIRQRNKAEQTQKCVMQSLIDTLSKKEANSKNLAALSVIQEAEGLMTKNQTSKDGCNVVNKDMSSNDYYENMQKCNQEAFADQTNEIFACGGMEDVAQENLSTQRNECLMSAGVIKREEVKEQSENTSTTESKQKATGITPAAIASSILSCLCCCSIISIILSMLGYFASTMEQ